VFAAATLGGLFAAGLGRLVLATTGGLTAPGLAVVFGAAAVTMPVAWLTSPRVTSPDAVSFPS
jgi:hypothetical protein